MTVSRSTRPAETAPKIEVRSRADLRQWLAAEHATSGSVWLITWKKGTPHYVPFSEYVEELLCWGWIDSVPRKVDADRSSTLISPRKPASAWSAVNKALVEKARGAGAMTEAGEAAIGRAKENGAWGFLDDVEALILPEDLSAALGEWLVIWNTWPRSLRRAWLEKIKRAKTDATRQKRIEACVTAARANAPKMGL